MCTVTLLSDHSSDKGFILTSSRDEAPGRKTRSPDFYVEKGVKMIFPKDAVAGGTWLGVSERKRLLCLLNGEFERHDRNPPYRLSRGVVVKDLLAVTTYEEAVRHYDLSGVEPFTIIGVEWQEELKFSELVWDGTRKHFKPLPQGPQIWSSSPLYSLQMKELRKSWFGDFLNRGEVTPQKLLEFHESAGIGDKNVDVVMDRGFVKTRSISQVKLSEGKIDFHYHDLATGEVSNMAFSDDFQD